MNTALKKNYDSFIIIIINIIDIMILVVMINSVKSNIVIACRNLLF